MREIAQKYIKNSLKIHVFVKRAQISVSIYVARETYTQKNFGVSITIKKKKNPWYCVIDTAFSWTQTTR